MKYKFSILIFLFTSFVLKAQINNKLDESLESLVKFIASDEFQKLKVTNDDLSLVDSIYNKALKINDNNISESLLALTFATLPFDRMPINIPIINSVSNLQLQEIDSVLFVEKNKNLPSNLFFDTPSNGDRDKLAHFFGNAFLSYNVSIFNISKILGIFVELFEESFKVGGGLDNRDLKVNYLGEFFGNVLNQNKNIMPSEVLSLYILLHLKFYN